MSGGSIVALIVLIAAFVLLIVESIAEAGVINLSRSRARLLLSREPDNRRALRLNQIIQDRERTLGSFAVGRSLAIATGFAAALYIVVRETSFGWEALLLTGLVGFVVIGVAQAIPRRLATISPEGFGLLLVPVMDALDTLFVAPARAMEAPAWLVTRIREVSTDLTPPATELEMILESSEGAELEPQERDMIRRVLDSGDTTVREAMVPRPDIIAVEAATPLTEATQLIVDRGVSRVPVYEAQIDHIIGVLYAKDILAEMLARGTRSVRELMRQPLLIPESKLADDLLAEFRALRVHIAIVLDEYGGTAGLVTIEDLLEEFVGEIEDEYDRDAASPVVRISDDEAIVDGRAPIDALDELFRCRPETGDFDTVAGFVFDRLGKMPQVGDEVATGGLTLAVIRMEGRRISRIRVRRAPREGAGDAGAAGKPENARGAGGAGNNRAAVS